MTPAAPPMSPACQFDSLAAAAMNKGMDTAILAEESKIEQID